VIFASPVLDITPQVLSGLQARGVRAPTSGAGASSSSGGTTPSKGTAAPKGTSTPK
jgi:hypothetical protein